MLYAAETLREVIYVADALGGVLYAMVTPGDDIDAVGILSCDTCIF